MKEALLVIDVQNEYFTGKLPVTSPVPEVLRISSGQWTGPMKAGFP